jgi:hypothetical protein
VSDHRLPIEADRRKAHGDDHSQIPLWVRGGREVDQIHQTLHHLYDVGRGDDHSQIRLWVRVGRGVDQIHQTLHLLLDAVPEGDLPPRCAFDLQRMRPAQEV